MTEITATYVYLCRNLWQYFLILSKIYITKKSKEKFPAEKPATNEESKKSGKKINQMKHHPKRKVKNVLVNRTQVLAVLITANRIKQKMINRQHQKLIMKKVIKKSQL